VQTGKAKLVKYNLTLLSLYIEYGWDTEFTAFCSVTDFLPAFNDRREIWHEVLTVSKTGLLKFWRQYPQGLQNCGPLKGIIWRDMHFANALV